ncbi:MAG: peptidoglycan-binding protein [Nannocystaceae bacterium]|nr:peptidoglycan-binding protein [Nannocystaceae bacterium]
MRYGVANRRICEAPENRELFKTRGPNVLFEDDQVFVPADETKVVSLACDGVHTLVYRPHQQTVSFQFCRGGIPRGHDPVTWRLDGGQSTEGHLDARGWLRVSAPMQALRLVVVLFPDTDFSEAHTFVLAHLDPSVQARGLQQRLNNIGFCCGAEDGDAAEHTAAALKAFQTAHGLPPTGEPDAVTLALLGRCHEGEPVWR